MTNEEMREATGNLSAYEPEVHLFYLLLRDHVPASVIETVFTQIEAIGFGPVTFTNGHLARYACLLTERLQKATRLR